MGYLDRAISIKRKVEEQSNGPRLRIFNYGFNVNSVAVKMLGDHYTSRYDLKVIPGENLLVFCKADDGCMMTGSKTVPFCRVGLRKLLENIIPRMEGYEYFTYVIDGEYIPDENIVVFDIKKAKRV